MTHQRDFKGLVRQRMAATGEPYTKARAYLAAQRERICEGSAADHQHADVATTLLASPRRVESIVLKVLDLNARVRTIEDGRDVTFRGDGLHGLVPGHVAELEVTKEWEHRDAPYASGRVLGSRLDVKRLGLVPIPLYLDGERELAELLAVSCVDLDTRAYFKAFFGRTVPTYRMDDVAYVWAEDRADESEFLDDDIVTVSNELAESGDHAGARRLLMDALLPDLRFLDAHAHLGNRAFDHWPELAVQHYGVGVAIGDLSVGPELVGIIPWDVIENRAYLRCLHGYGLALWKLGRRAEAESVMRRLLRLNPSDEQQAGWSLAELRGGRPYEEFDTASL